MQEIGKVLEVRGCSLCTELFWYELWIASARWAEGALDAMS